MKLSLTGARWTTLSVPDERIEAVRQRSGLSDVAARVLALRTGDDASHADWLEPSFDHLHDPWRMLGMQTAVDRLRRALHDGRRVRIITDYDVDGTTSSLVLQAALRLCRADVALDWHIPNRFAEGYGFSVAAAEKAAADGVDLIVTADIGVRDHAAVDAARERGVDVLICDHHLPAGESVPSRAIVLCPPQAGCSYPNRSLAACGVSLKLAQALLAEHPKRDAVLRSMLKLAAIGTVADLVPLTTLENRAIVALGLAELNRGPHQAGLAALLDASGLTAGRITEWDLGFRVGPRINAAGRVADAGLVVSLLTTRDPAEARTLAGQLEQLNRERQDIQRRLVAEVLETAGKADTPFVVVSGPEESGWHRGVVGIVASRVKDQFHRPVAVVSIQGDLAVGSVRSVPGVHAVHALDASRDLLEKYGGHPAAAGFTVRTERLEALRQRLCDWVTDHAASDALEATHDVDAEVPAERLGARLFGELEALGPFGMGNPKPRLAVRRVRPFRVESKGAEGKLLKCLLPGGIEALWWDRGEHARTLSEREVDLLGSLDEHAWKGQRRLQFQIRDVRISG